jgi:hypothetical protein
MATETGEETTDSAESDGGLSPYMRSVTVTTGAMSAGILAVLVSNIQASGLDDLSGVLWLVAAIVVQFTLYSAVGIDTSEFGAKDYLYIGFMTFTLWFISWGILLTAGVEL